MIVRGNIAPLRAEIDRLRRREQELLETTNRYLERARAAEALLRVRDDRPQEHGNG